MLRRADDHGGAEATYELGRLLRSQGRREEGEAAFARARARGSERLAKLVERNRRCIDAKRLVDQLPEDARDLTAPHGAAVTRLGQLLVENGEVLPELIEQLQTYDALAVERGAPDNSEHSGLAPYLSTEERTEFLATIDQALDAMTASVTITTWIRRSHAAPVFERLTGESLEMPRDDDEPKERWRTYAVSAANWSRRRSPDGRSSCARRAAARTSMRQDDAPLSSSILTSVLRYLK